ncbi:MAG: hypothetical protein J6Y12_02480 [Lachnospiraceae bacterium]|nr:hypothetical protein [Lachnospiraceae bacterium]MBP5703023.1 hypothetical protein [Lachnospiraceae bacterium]MBP5762606.1 hypothetical protein [Lachnospiraceae bacterium]
MKKGILKQNGVHLEKHEFKTVELFLNLGYDVELIPPSGIKGLHMPDIMLEGIPWEMKAPLGGGKTTIRHTMQNAGHQSCNIIIDLRRCKLNQNTAIKDIESYYKLSKRIRKMKVIVNDLEIIDYGTK